MGRTSASSAQVVFFSRLWHEVLPSERLRRALTLWILRPEEEDSWIPTAFWGSSHWWLSGAECGWMRCSRSSTMFSATFPSAARRQHSRTLCALRRSDTTTTGETKGDEVDWFQAEIMKDSTDTWAGTFEHWRWYFLNHAFLEWIVVCFLHVTVWRNCCHMLLWNCSQHPVGTVNLSLEEITTSSAKRDGKRTYVQACDATHWLRISSSWALVAPYKL